MICPELLRTYKKRRSPGITSSHHVFGIKHLAGEFRHGEVAVLLGAPRGERGEAGHEEVEAGEGNHVHGQLSEVGVQLGEVLLLLFGRANKKLGSNNKFS